MFVEDRASLVVRSTALSVDEITQLLGLEPTRVVRQGDATSVRAGANTTYPHSAWILTVEGPDDQNDEQVASLRRLLELVGDRDEVLGQLRAQAETEIRWSGYSESAQGGFVIPSGVINRVASLGCDLIGTVYFGDLLDEAGSE